MFITVAQVRQACALLRWSSPRLSRRARVPYDVARKARTDDAALAGLHIMDVSSIRTALEQAGVRFGEDADGRPSAVLANIPQAS